MFEIKKDKKGDILLAGRFDAAQTDGARPFFDALDSTTTVRFDKLNYISSAALGILLKTQKRLGESGHGLRLAGLNAHIRDVFHIAGFDTVFEILP